MMSGKLGRWKTDQFSKVNIIVYPQCDSERTQRKLFVHQAKGVGDGSKKDSH